MELGENDRKVAAGELLDWIDQRLEILTERRPYMDGLALDTDNAEVQRLCAFKDDLTEISLCACNDLEPWSSVETLSRDDSNIDVAFVMTGALHRAKSGLWKKSQS